MEASQDGAFSSITINDLLVVLPQGIGLSAFSLLGQPCQILVSVTCHLLPHCLKPSVSNKDGVSDDWDTLGLGKSVNYSALSKSLLKRLTEATINEHDRVESLEDLVEVAVSHCAEESPSSLECIDVTVERRRALLFSDSVSVHTTVVVEYPQAHDKDTVPDYVGLRTRSRTLNINGIQADTIIGLNPHERLERQRLEMDLEVDLGRLFGLRRSSAELGFDYKSLGQTALQVRLNSVVAIGKELNANHCHLVVSQLDLIQDIGIACTQHPAAPAESDSNIDRYPYGSKNGVQHSRRCSAGNSDPKARRYCFCEMS